MSRAISLAVLIAAVALGLSLVATSIRVLALERRELDAAGPWRAAGEGGGPLLEATLLRGDEATFELCAADSMDAARWAGVGALAVVRTDRSEEMFSLAIDDALLRGAARSGEEACVVFARVRELSIDEDRVPVAIELVRAGNAIDDVPVRARLLARRTLGSLDVGLVLVVLALAVALVLGLAALPAGEGGDTGARGGLRAALGVGIVVAAGITIGALGPGGATAGLMGGLLLGAVELAVAYALIRPGSEGPGTIAVRTAALGLARPALPPRWLAGPSPEPRRAERLASIVCVAGLALAPLVGVLLFAVARLALALVPSTGRAPVEVFVSWPSGMLSFAALAVVAPIAEEVFFRGLVYGALRGPGGAGREALAVAGSWLLFALAHVPQDWGSWGGLLSVLVAGLGLTLVRAASGTVLVPCLAHLVYNGLLASSALAAGAG